MYPYYVLFLNGDTTNVQLPISEDRDLALIINRFKDGGNPVRLLKNLEGLFGGMIVEIQAKIKDGFVMVFATTTDSDGNLFDRHLDMCRIY